MQTPSSPQSTTGEVPASGHPLRYLWRHRWWILGGVVCLVLTNVLAQAFPWVVKLTIEAVEHRRGASQVSHLALLAAALAVGQALARIPSRIFIFNAARQAEYRLRGVVFERLCQLDATFYRRFPTGDLMSRLTNDLSSVRALFGPAVLHVANTLFAYCIALPLMLRIDPTLALLALVPYPVLLLGARAFARGIYSRSHALQSSLASMTTRVQDDISGIREVKLSRLAPQRTEGFTTSSRDYLDEAVRLARWRAALIPFVGLGAGASVVIVLWAGGARVVHHELSLGDLVALNLYVGMLAWPTMSIGWILSLWQRGIASWHRLLEITRPEAPLAVDLSRPPSSPGGAPPAIDVEHLSLTLDARPVLHDVALHIPSGSLCAVVGRVGSGKTTLVQALARLSVVPKGSIHFDGQDVCQLPVEQVRAHIAYAPQTAFLFSATIADNIAFGLSTAADPTDAPTRQRIEWAVEVAGLSPDLASLPDGLDTLVGERGIALSGGQRQRVALARALVSERQVLLLDDSLSAVDADTERRILVGLKSALADRTVVLVSHRLSALQHADQVVVLDRGAVAQSGTHADLLADETGIYARLYRRQSLLFQLEQSGGEQ